MLSILPSFVLFPLSFSLFCLNLAVCGFIIFLGGLIKSILPFTFIQQALHRPMHTIYRFWALNNYLIIILFNNVEWKIIGDEKLNKQSWYLVIANHQSWLDILIFSNFARTRIPEPKYFLKESLKKVPFLGIACWALDMPFMKRHSKSFLKKHPHLIGSDIETTKKACEKFKHKPTTIMNFVEGTRFTTEKHQNQSNNFKHLLTPKSGGIAYALTTLGEHFDKILNVRLIYPKNQGHIMKQVLKGQLKEVIIDVEQISNIDDLRGDYINDTRYKRDFHRWLNALWKSNDIKINKYFTK